MEQKNKYWDIGWEIARMTIAASVFAYFAGRYYEKLQNPQYCFFLSFLLSISIFAIQNSSHNKKIYIGGIVVVILSYVAVPKNTFYAWFSEYSYLVLLFGIVLLLFWGEKRLYFRSIVAVTIFIVLLVSGRETPDYSKIILALSVFYFLDVILHISQQKDSRNLFPIVILTIAICISLPVKQEPIRWEIITNKIKAIKEICTNYFYEQYMKDMDIGEEFSIATIGYNENQNSVFGGKLLDNNTIVLRLETSGKLYNRLYLAGTIRDTYTGKGWERTPEKDQKIPEYKLDMLERLYGLYAGGLLQLNDEKNFHFRDIRIEYGTIKTKSIFYPTNTFNIANSEKQISYYVNMFEVNETSIEFQEYLKNALQIQSDTGIQKDFQKTINQGNNSLLKLRLNEILEHHSLQELFQNRRAEMESKYLQLPDKLPQRVKELAQNCTMNAKSDYEKILALQEYLVKMPYSTEVPKMSENKDLVDAFLFEQKQGYCTYFASALTVMSRSLGIPARYIEGISVSCGKEGRGVYQVKAAAAHAWVEVYIDGYGWIVVEATPRYGQGQSANPWVQEENQTTTSISTENRTDNSSEEVPAEVETVINVQVKNTLRIILIVIIVVFLFVISFLLQKWHKRSEYLKAGEKEKFLICMQKILKYLKYLGYPLLESETIGEYKKRLIHKEELQYLNWEELLVAFEAIRYSEKEPTQKDLKMLEEAAGNLKDTCMKKDGKLRVLVTFWG